MIDVVMRDLEMDFVNFGALLYSEDFIDMPMHGEMVSDVLVQAEDEEARFGVGLLAHLENVQEIARVVNVLHPAMASAGVATPWSGDLGLALGEDVAINLVAHFGWKTEEG
jgi:hypothetical protein